jgi:hypothetical protein
MDTTSVFKFATIRNATDAVTIEADYTINPNSPLVTALIGVNLGSGTSAEKLADFNDLLQDFLDGTDFIKTKAQLDALVATETGETDFYNLLYDNIVARTITRSNNSPIFKLLCDQIKAEHLAVWIATYSTMTVDELRILLPDGLILSFLTGSPSTVGVTPAPTDYTSLLEEYNTFVGFQNLIHDAQAQNVIRFQLAHGGAQIVVPNTRYSAVNEILGKRTLTMAEAETIVNLEMSRMRSSGEEDEAGQILRVQMNKLKKLVEDAKEDGVTTFERTRLESGTRYTPILTFFEEASMSFEVAARRVSDRLTALSHDLIHAAPVIAESFIGNGWVNVSSFPQGENVAPEITDNSILIYSNGCYLKFPFQVADLRVIEQQTVGYLPGEIAHINNTQPGEENKRKTRRLKRTEVSEGLIIEDEVSRETDSQSTEKFALEREASNVQAEESSWNVNASVSASYGPISASVDGGYENSNSSVSSNSSSQLYAKETVQRVVDRVSKKVKQERSTKTIEEFEEIWVRKVDNKLSTSPKSYVYRWLNKLSRATLKNYGKRLIFQFDVAHPSHYHLSRSIQTQPGIVLPMDPRKFRFQNVLIDGPDKITRQNYYALADLYKAKVEQPPVEMLIINKAFSNTDDTRKTEEIEVPKGYGLVRGRYNGVTWDHNFVMNIGSSAMGVNYGDPNHDDTIFRWINGGWGANEFLFSNYPNGILITDKLAITFWGDKYNVNLEIEARLTDDAFRAWQIKAFQAIVEGYETLVLQAEAKKSEFNPNLPGLHPQKKMQLIRDELKKETLRKMFRCNSFNVKDKYVVGKEYQSDCCKDATNAEKVRFLETVFDWRNMTYEFFPYFYGSRDVMSPSGQKIGDNWNDIQKFTDDDPHFEAFLQASYATVRVPVFRNSEKEIAAINFILNNSLGNYEVVPEGMLSIVEELELEPATPFDDTIPTDPIYTVDLGVYQLPTELVILECGTQDGVMPNGFPDIDGQYSPAIIADTCGA